MAAGARGLIVESASALLLNVVQQHSTVIIKAGPAVQSIYTAVVLFLTGPSVRNAQASSIPR